MSERTPQAAFAELARTDGRGALVTVLDGPAAGAKLYLGRDGERLGTLGDPDLDAAAARAADELMWVERSERREEAGVAVFVDVVHPPPRVIAFGAVDYSACLATLARALGWRSFVVDPRARFARPERFPDADGVVAAWPREAVAELGGIDRATAVAVLTHDPKLDDAALELALASEAFYIGAMGSRRAQATRRERLLELGIDAARQERISAPIGLDLGALSPQETALSIMAEIVAFKHERSGGRLAHTAGRIHEVGA